MKTAIIFSGQGSQYHGMGKELCEVSSAARAIYGEAAETLGWDVLELNESQLSDTRFAQLATFTLSVAAHEALEQALLSSGMQLEEVVLAGFSLGEYTALTVAGVIGFPVALKLIELRSELMSEASRRTAGAMYAVIGLDDEKIVSYLSEGPYAGQVFPANFNSPGQLVIAGLAEACREAAGKLLDLGAKKVVKLNVSGAFHTALMQDAAAELAAYAKGIHFNPLSKKLYSNLSGSEIPSTVSMPDYLAEHMVSPVKWASTIQNLHRLGIGQYIECGPQKTLLGLVKRLDRKAKLLNVEDGISLEKTLASLTR